MNNKSNFRRGSVELLILHLLSQQDYYGYEISTLIREQTDGYLNIPVGSLYPALYKLIDAGYISDYKKQVGRRYQASEGKRIPQPASDRCSTDFFTE